jgi:hypothetical protein
LYPIKHQCAYGDKSRDYDTRAVPNHKVQSNSVQNSTNDLVKRARIGFGTSRGTFNLHMVKPIEPAALEKLLAMIQPNTA